MSLALTDYGYIGAGNSVCKVLMNGDIRMFKESCSVMNYGI
jgi:hypothetical protein